MLQPFISTTSMASSSLSPNSITSIYCGFVVQQIHNKRDDASVGPRRRGPRRRACGVDHKSDAVDVTRRTSQE